MSLKPCSLTSLPFSYLLFGEATVIKVIIELYTTKCHCHRNFILQVIYCPWAERHLDLMFSLTLINDFTEYK